MKNLICRLLETIKLRVSRISHRTDIELCFLEYLKRAGIKSVVDVGANVGQFSEKLLKAGFAGHVYSIEPQNEAFRRLKAVSKNFINWNVYQCGIGSEAGTLSINISKNSVSSSFKEMSPLHIDANQESKYVNKEAVNIITLDQFREQHIPDTGTIALKIDTQGFEFEVLKGGLKTLEDCPCIMLEVSFVELYADSPSFADIFTYMDSLGYFLYRIDRGFMDPATGQSLQADVIFCKR